jgi:hypothetical protein
LGGCGLWLNGEWNVLCFSPLVEGIRNLSEPHYARNVY